MMRIYWANSIFSEADRTFNDRCVSSLRSKGFEVLHPQENAFNQRESISDASRVFMDDTTMIEKCDVFVACIDQETIDSGVACELGIAWSMNKKIIALYTDFRQFRSCEFRMYKNPYIIGCITSRGKIVSTFESLMLELQNAIRCQ